MSTSDLDALAQLINRDPATFSSLPLPLAQRIFLALPPDARGRACCVCRAWRDTLADPSLWTRLDLSAVREFAVVERPRFVFLLRGAARRAKECPPPGRMSLAGEKNVPRREGIPRRKVAGRKVAGRKGKGG